MKINNVTIIWHGNVRRFENVKDLEHGKGFVSFTDGKIHRFFSGVPYETESYYPDDKPESLPGKVIQ